MKNKSLFIAGSLVLLAACNTNTDQNGYTQEQVDSMVNARVDEERMKMMIENDSIINAMAQWRADSIIASMKGGKVTTRTTSSSTTTSTTTTPKAPDKGSVTTRPGADDGKPKPVIDRPGADDNKPKSVTDRPGSDRK